MKTAQETLFELIKKEAIARGQEINPDWFDDLKKDPAHKIVLEAMESFAAQSVREDRESRWISSKDRIPKNNERVLAHTGFRMLEQSYSLGSDQDDEWFKRSFPHWQPLPSPPTNKG